MFKCPADGARVRPSSGPYAGKLTPRVRTMVMNIWFGGFEGTLDPNETFEDGWHLSYDRPVGLRSLKGRTINNPNDFINIWLQERATRRIR